jgi:hypothetical protein
MRFGPQLRKSQIAPGREPGFLDLEGVADYVGGRL